MTNFDWSDDKIELAKKMWSSGFSATQIAIELGGGVTRNAVIGKMHRCFGPQKEVSEVPKVVKKPVRRSVPKPNVKELLDPPKKQEPAVKPPQPPVEIGPEPEPRHLTITQLTERTCRWPFGDPRDESFFYCGADTPVGKPYCDHHHRIAFPEQKPLKPRKLVRTA